MGKKCDLSQFLKGQVHALNREGYSQRAIATQLKISRCVVQNALHILTPRRQNCGRIRKTSSRKDRLMKAIVVRSPHVSSARIG